MSALNLIKVKERPDCPSCEAEIALRETREKDQSRRRYYMQSKRINIIKEWKENGRKFRHFDPQENKNDWFDIDQVSEGEMHARCQKCKTYIEFEIKDGKIIGSKLRR